jgi:hypothetical protein
MTPRIVCQFSCGAASAVATKLTLAKYPGREIAIVNAFLVEEDTDNRRFLADCEQWFQHPITVLRDEKYGASTDEVWRRRRYLMGPQGAPCSRALKRTVLEAFGRHDDLWIMGYTVEERDRFDDFLDHHPLQRAEAPLIDHSLSKSDCLAMVDRAGIALPRMYRLGYHNANCVGCPKGGEGYWNKIRRDFPERFEAVAAIQASIGLGAYFFRDRETGRRYSLRELPPDKGRHDTERPIECSFFCVAAEETMAP